MIPTRRTVLVAMMVLTASTAWAETLRPVPKFRDFPAREIYRGAPARVILDTEFKRTYRTLFREGTAERANDFAGRYSFVIWGCGSAGVCSGGVVDRKTGRVHDLPEDATLLDFEYRPGSALLVAMNHFRGDLDPRRERKWFFFRFDGSQFRLIDTRSDP